MSDSNSSASSPAPEPVLILIRDLMFVSKVTGTAARLGVPVKVIREPAKLESEAGRTVLVDLSLPGAADAAGKWAAAPGRQAVGFIGHTETAAMQAAKAAGVSRVMTKGTFTAELERLLSGT